MKLEPRDAEAFLQDIVDWGVRAQNHVHDGSEDEFMTNLILQDAVSKCIESIDEAANRATRADPDILARHPSFDFRAACAMRNALAHGYYTIKPDVLWSTVHDSLPSFMVMAAAVLESRKTNKT